MGIFSRKLTSIISQKDMPLSKLFGSAVRSVGAIIALLFAALVFVPSASVAASVAPTLTPGNPTCQDLGYDFGLKPKASSGSETTPGSYTSGGVTVTWSFSRTNSTSYIDWSSNIAPAAVIVKGSDAANVYDYTGTPANELSDTDLVTPINASGRPAGLSHLEFCYMYNAVVAKTAVTSYTRSYDWTVAKSADRTELTLMPGQTMPVVYSIKVGNSYVDSNWTVSGVITITNPWNKAATIVSVTDSLTENVSCPSNVLPALGSVECTYSASVGSAASGTNTATAVTNYGGSNRTATGSKDYVFGDPTTVVDGTATLTDVRSCPTGFTCTVSSGSVPNGLVVTGPGSYSYTVDVRADGCGESGNVVNTATLIEKDSGASHESTVTIPVKSADCGVGCTLTQGYWKTHSDRGPARYDDNWANLGSLQEDTAFFSSGQTWYQVFWTPPKGNVYYNLAHQYMAAQLNVLNGASTTSEVSAALAEAKAIFERSTGTKLLKTDTTRAGQLATLLDGYNNGLTGPGHCSE